MKKPVYLVLALWSVTIIVTFSCQSWAREGCSSLLELTNVEVQSSKIAQFLSSRAYDRLLRTQPEALSTLPEQIVAAPLGLTKISVDGDDLIASINVTKGTDTIDIDIKYVSIRSGDKGVLGFIKAFSSLGKQNRTLSMVFPRVIAAIAAGLEKSLEADPALKTITISGSKVVNLALTRQLREFGFEPDRPTAFRLFLNSVQGEGAYAMWIHNIAMWTGLTNAMPEPIYIPLKLAKNAVILVAGYRYRELGRNWTIEFQVLRETAANFPKDPRGRRASAAAAATAPTLESQKLIGT